MSSTIPTTPTYSTYTEWEANTRSAAAKAIITDDASFKPYALEAETIIDEYVNCVTKAVSTQTRKFPHLNADGASEMPYKVKLAHIYIVTDLVLKGDQEANEAEVKSESWSGSGYSRTLAADSDRDSIVMRIPPLALRLLKEWCTSTAKLTY